MQIAPCVLACGDFVQGPYPSTLEGAVRSGIAAADKLPTSKKTYTFRIRIDRAPTDTIECKENKIYLDAANLPEQLVLYNKTPNQAIKEALHFCLIAGGFDSEEKALEAGKLHEAALMVALARVRVGANFGDRAVKGFLTPEGLRQLELQHGHRFVNDVHGLMAYTQQPPPKFALFKANMLRGANPQVFQEAFRSALASKPNISTKERIAYVLFNASFFQITAESRFLLLVMAIEALIEPEKRSDEAVAHVKSLIDATKAANIQAHEKDSMQGALQWLFHESIKQAGKRFVRTRLGTRKYEERSASAFFSHVYDMRSNLVHGNLPYPSYEAINAIAAPLEVFVSDLLTQPFIGLPQQSCK